VLPNIILLAQGVRRELESSEGSLTCAPTLYDARQNSPYDAATVEGRPQPGTLGRLLESMAQGGRVLVACQDPQVKAEVLKALEEEKPAGVRVDRREETPRYSTYEVSGHSPMGPVSPG
jgi:hypothetical protein